MELRRLIWVLCFLIAFLGWGGLTVFLALVPPSEQAYPIVFLLLWVSTSSSLAPLIWLVSRLRRWGGPGQSPVLAVRLAMWAGLWVALSAALRLVGFFDWVIALALAVVLYLVESFVRQNGRPQPAGKR